MRSRQLICLLVLTATGLTGCLAPVVVGGGAALTTAAAREKGLGGSISDTQIENRIKADLYNQNTNWFQSVGVTVQNGEVLLTGTVPNQDAHIEVLKAAWKPATVKKVMDEVKVVKDGESFTDDVKDSWISTQVKTRIVFDPDIQSINYSIKTVDQIVYIMGIAQDQKELDRVLEHARNVGGVKKVKNFVEVKKDGSTILSNPPRKTSKPRSDTFDDGSDTPAVDEEIPD